MSENVIIHFILDGVETKNPPTPLIIKQNPVIETIENAQSYNPHALCNDGNIHVQVGYNKQDV